MIKIPGVGIDIKRIENIDVDRNKKREDLGIGKDQKVLLFVGEMTKNKNHRLIIEAVAKLHDSSITAVFCGHGQEEQHLRELAKTLHVEEQIRFLGYRKDVLEIYKIADLFVFPSMREGLPVALIEAMASGLAVVCSDIRGNRDLIKDNQGGRLLKGHSIDVYVKAIKELLDDNEKGHRYGQNNKMEIQNYDQGYVIQIMKELYGSYS